jgi:hypothetical protein
VLDGSNPRGIERKSLSNPEMLKIVAPLSRTASSMGIYRTNAAIPGRHLHRAARRRVAVPSGFSLFPGDA